MNREQMNIALVLDQLARGPAIVRQLIFEMPPDLRKRPQIMNIATWRLS
jgi:hypothetical protein